MNYEQPRQRETDQRWDYTNRNDNRIYPLGYCAGWERAQLSPEAVQMMHPRMFGAETVEEAIEKHRAKLEPFRAKYHDDGHATADEARECHRQYQLDQELRFDPDTQSALTRHRCEAEGCEEYTSGGARIGQWHHWSLCAAHRNRETVETLFKAGDSIHS